MRPPVFITFTGLDARTDLQRAKALADAYKIEWGVLFSPERQGKDNRYPEVAFVQEALFADIDLSAHLCGGYSRSIMGGEAPDLPIDIDLFDRAQVNHAAPVVNRILDVFPNWGPRFITQTRATRFPADDNVDWLFDPSGGRGKTPNEWPAHPGDNRLVGYAGGIGPENVQDILKQIDCDGRYWIDMESRIRTDDWLDLDKVEAVCRAVYG